MRYIGANPNNYVYFNCDDNKNPTAETCELWRIIGIMNNIDDGTGRKETRIKIIRNESIGRYSWDTSHSTLNSGGGVNEWSQADLMKLLNPGYEENIDFDSRNNEMIVNNSLYWNRKTGICYNGQSNSFVACDFSLSGLKEEAKSMIGDAVWNTGSNEIEVAFNKIIASKFYEFERSANTGKNCLTGSSCNDDISRTTSWKGMVGLMYPSDYGYATSGSSIRDRSICLNAILRNWESMNDCKKNDWLYDSANSRWTLSPYASSSSNSEVFLINSAGFAYDFSECLSMNIHPTVYLKSNTKIISGDGSSNNPFIASLS